MPSSNHKLAFSTLGCPLWDLETIISHAVGTGFTAVDFRGYLGITSIYTTDEFGSGLKETVSAIRDAGLSVSCFSSSIHGCACDADKKDHNVRELDAYLALCDAFGTPFIRIFGGAIGDMDRQEAVAATVEHCSELVHRASGTGVSLLIETHDDWVNSGHIRDVITQVGSEHLGVVWDVNHTYRYGHETPLSTWITIGPWVRNTHWKDSFIIYGDPDRSQQLCMIGEGGLPLRDIYEILVSDEYDGYFTLEWEKKWHPELPAPEIAFPAFVAHIDTLYRRSLESGTQ